METKKTSLKELCGLYGALTNQAHRELLGSEPVIGHGTALSARYGIARRISNEACVPVEDVGRFVHSNDNNSNK